MKLIRPVVLTLALFTLFASTKAQQQCLGATFNADGSMTVRLATCPPSPTPTPAPSPTVTPTPLPSPSPSPSATPTPSGFPVGSRVVTPSFVSVTDDPTSQTQIAIVNPGVQGSVVEPGVPRGIRVSYHIAFDGGVNGWVNDDHLNAIAQPSATPTPSPSPSPVPATTCTWIVAAGASGDGSVTKPWSFRYIANGSPDFGGTAPPTQIVPGNNICLRGGVYQGLYQTIFRGTSSAPITIMPYPGEHAIIDDGTTWPDPRSIGTVSQANASNVAVAPGAAFTSADIGSRIRFGIEDAIVTAVNSPGQVVISQTNSTGGAISGTGTVGPTPPQSSTLLISGAYTIVRDLEITNSNPNRTDGRLGGIGIDQAEAIGCNASISVPCVQIINNVIHDAGGGLSKNDLAANVLFYGNVMFNNGWDDRNTGLKQGGTGHGIYAANNSGSLFTRIYNNIMVDEFGYGLHAYSAGTGHLFNFDVQGNVFYDNGYWTRTGKGPYCDTSGNGCEGGGTPNFFIGHRQIENFTLKNNFGFQREGRYADNLQIGYVGVENLSGVIQNNVIVNGGNIIDHFEALNFTNNVLASNYGSLEWYKPDAYDRTKQIIDANTYYFYPNPPGDCSGAQFFGTFSWQTAAQWKTNGFDKNSTFAPCPIRPTGVKITIQPNAYDPNRAHIIINNFSKSATIAVDLSSILKSGDSFEIRNPQDYYGPLVLSGTYQGPVLIPMTRLTVARPVGWTGAMIPSSGPDFGVFVLIKKALK